jgi:microcystin-dependent protein
VSEFAIHLALFLLVSLAIVLMGGSIPAYACQSEPFIGSVCMTAANFCPRGFATADGQMLPIAQNSALFSLLGTTYGGDGRTTFALPDLRGRSAVHVGAGPGLSNIRQGQKDGTETVTQTPAHMASHSHPALTTADLRGKAGNNAGDSTDLTGRVLAGRNNAKIYASGPADTTMEGSSIMAATTVISAGASQPQENRSPFLGIRYCIALNGVFPSRN